MTTMNFRTILISHALVTLVGAQAFDVTLRPQTSFHWDTRLSPCNTTSLQSFPTSPGFVSGTVDVTHSISSTPSAAVAGPTAGGFDPSLSSTSHLVSVGASGKLIFEPNQVNATTGDIIQFDFLGLNHTLTQSRFEDPCLNVGGFNTDFHQYNPTNKSGRFIVSFQVESEEPQWFFCAQNLTLSHCEAGMVFGINTGNMSAFIDKAAAFNSSMFSTGPINDSFIQGLGTRTASLSVTSVRIPVATTSAVISPPINNNGLRLAAINPWASLCVALAILVNN